ncbi:hypothetical protein DTO006G1_4348 [Penicillium roqueforti]|nr:hypothetical protein CBS147337_7525 [Penicillium roqueforti]KAI2681606.1 hypothetical protein CBS147355_2816 [Penicillium roqueforti]KAI2703947.1 hypothetical protein CBS147372_2416 [Penicillium roqueforti]KAI2760861.1 hypothetical protein DTO006G1_4348 [Penicillium roqueforti]KAI3157501.1 hypothetical protein CBS147317_5240 [Penicillium roqueforti]
MEAQYAYDMRYLLNRKEEPLPLFPPKTPIYQPFSEATETFEQNGYRGYSDSSPMRSVASFGTGSISTASTPDNVTTPDSTGLTAFDFHIDENDIRGPNGPHLFWSSADSDQNSAMDIDVDQTVQQTPIHTTGPYHHRASKFDPFRRDTPVPNRSADPTPEPQQPTPIARQVLPSSRMIMPHEWTPSEVVGWMQSLGVEDDIVNTFLANDISGSILLELQTEDLKELEIASFGKRHKLMGHINKLRGSGMFTDTDTAPSSTYTTSSRTDTASSRTYTTSLGSRNSSVTSDVASTRNTSVMTGNTYNSFYHTDEESCHVKPRVPRARRQNYDDDVHRRNDLAPGDSVSIVAIEQVLPKLHRCSKGEGCHKWQKQQDKLARLAQDLPFEHFGSGRIVAGDPGNPKTAPNLLMSPKSEITPSLTASSDILGPGKLSAFQLSQEKLMEVKPRDPQENVRNFLNFQSLDRLQTDNQPATPPTDFVSLPESESCDSAKITPTLSEHLRHLPRLRIPSMHDSSDGSVFTESIFTNEDTSALRTVTPSILSRRNHFNDRTAVPSRQEFIPREVASSPADYYRVDPCYRSETPLSDVDAPITAIPIGQVSREDSQSVPPNMRFGDKRYVAEEPIIRPFSTKVGSHWRSPAVQNVTTSNPLEENYTMSPIETLEDLQRTPRAPQFRNNILFPSTRRREDDVTHSGWMKKRKTIKLLRHDWEDHHFTLKGTKLSMHDDPESAHRDSKALEHIDVDDYAVACSSHVSMSKLTAAFKKTVLKRNDNPQDVSAFSFSLVPTPNGNGYVDRKTMFLNSGKSHHFAVKTRDERIDWMRELMLAKAFKRGQAKRADCADITLDDTNMI